MSEKLYYRDAYISEFSATVLSVEQVGDRYATVLDKTAFFPEEGGQYSDRGRLGAVNVLDVKEKDGEIIHYTDSALEVGATVTGKIDFDERYEKMQCHTGEHILSGLFHSLFGLDNVGFHLGGEEVTMDIGAPLSRAELDRVECLANEIIYKNVEITTEFPTPDELLSMEYRSKLDLTENVRIVRIGEYDACACCAPHVKRTGEIGVIKILEAVKLRGGMRIKIAAGRRATRIFSELYDSAQKISELLSLKKSEIASGAQKLLSDYTALRAEYSAYRIKAMEERAVAHREASGNSIVYFPDATAEELIAYANIATERVGGALVLLTGSDGAYKYVISSASVDLRTKISDINKSLLGRGGGKPNMVQGSFGASYAEIEKYFS
ncbi:MAG: alanyl-tRNA editing protein [Clostridia bacterium]|nr:alanyl-tRNA editing protein [Clostridia bacterium]